MSSSRELYIIRHGERCDQVFDKWMQRSFDADGNYRRFDLNLPKQMPKRDDWRDFAKDAPLTRLGAYQASLTGEALSEAGVHFKHAFSSPSFRCVQTANFVLKSMALEENVRINVEPGLFEWLGDTYKNGAPKWMSPSQLLCNGFNINIDYDPFMDTNDLLKCMGETCKQWYERSHDIVSKILKQYDGNVLIVAHGGSMDPLTRMLTGKKPQTNGDFADLTPFCGLLRVQQKLDGMYEIVPPPINGFKHLSNFVYEWQKLNVNNE